MQFTVNVNEYNHSAGTARRFMLVEDAVYKRRVQFEEINANMPGQQFYQFIFLFQTNTVYKIALTSAGKASSCTKSTIPFPYSRVRAPSPFFSSCAACSRPSCPPWHHSSKSRPTRRSLARRRRAPPARARAFSLICGP